ncbi:hypothetical protein BKA64DRAFT_642366 [Cadophora sp. MPI-SDFR-AT-0126]|nr:hypothetical protein BKA64DRAFT_642366 [Leotiomycetes sp. MPI-SDFR-AT-0126]
MEPIKATTSPALRKPTIGETGQDLEKFEYFEKLPAEIRNRIFKIILKHKGPIHIIRSRNGPIPSSNFAAILATNKAICAEAKGYQYSINTFAVAFPGAAYNQNISHLDCSCRNLCPNFRSVTNVTIRPFHSEIAKRKSLSQRGHRIFCETWPREVGAVLLHILDGNDGVQPLPVKRLVWVLCEDNCLWVQDESSRPNVDIEDKNIPNMVEGHRADLKDENGVRKPLLVSEADLEAFYATVGGT